MVEAQVPSHDSDSKRRGAVAGPMGCAARNPSVLPSTATWLTDPPAVPTVSPQLAWSVLPTKENEMNGATELLGAFLAETAYEQLPAEVIDEAKRFVLDLLGVALGARATPEARIVTELVTSMGGRPESTIIGFGKNSSLNAALANAVMAHTLELDDTHRSSISHIGCAVIPAALAIAEARNVSGPEFLRAVILGYECMARVALAIQPSHWERGFMTAGTCGALGAGAAAAAILKLDRERMTTTLGLAGTQAGGLLECMFVSGDMSKRLNPGRAAANGIFAALLAEKGFSGPTTVLEGNFGFCKAMANSYSIERITANLGQSFEISRTSLKPYACCRYYHSAIDVILELREQGALDPSRIVSIEVRTHEKAVINRPHRSAPTSNCDAQMSLPYSLAVAVLEGRVTPEEFTEDKLRDRRIHQIAEKIRVICDPEIHAIFPEKWSNDVLIRWSDGRQFRMRADIAKGEPENPMSEREVAEKFASLAVPSLGKEAANEIRRMSLQLEKLGNVKDLTKRLVLS